MTYFSSVELKIKTATEALNRWTGAFLFFIYYALHQIQTFLNSLSHIFTINTEKYLIVCFLFSVFFCVDNVFTVRSYCENKFNIDPQMLSKKFGIAEDMDYWNVK